MCEVLLYFHFQSYVFVTKNLRSITVGIKIWHKPDFWHILLKHKPILLLEKLSKTLRQKTLTNSKISHVLEVLSFKEYDKVKAIQTWVGKICFVSGANYLTKGANVIISVIRNRWSGNTGCLNRNLYVMLKFTEWPKTLGMTSKKNIAFLKAISRFCANLDETKTDMVQFTKRWN